MLFLRVAVKQLNLVRAFGRTDTDEAVALWWPAARLASQDRPMKKKLRVAAEPESCVPEERR